MEYKNGHCSHWSKLRKCFFNQRFVVSQEMINVNDGRTLARIRATGVADRELPLNCSTGMDIFYILFGMRILAAVL